MTSHPVFLYTDGDDQGNDDDQGSEKHESYTRKHSVQKSWVNEDSLVQLVYIYFCGMINCLVHNQVCNLMFACGCLPMWSPNWPCNVHAQGPSNMRCPWCQPWLSPYTQGWFHLWIFNSSFDQKGLAVLALYASPWKWKLFVFAIVNITVGFVYKLIYNHTYFLGIGEPPLLPPSADKHADVGTKGGENATDEWGMTRFSCDWIGYLMLYSVGDVFWVLLFLGVWYAIRRFFSTNARDESPETPDAPQADSCVTTGPVFDAVVLA